jgi:hypothetical protein
MKCTCPKCHADIELELPEVTEEGIPGSCPACKAHLTIHTESFGGRAYRKSSEISCASCGNQLGPKMYCQSCGTPFPSYLVASLGRKRTRRKSTKIKLKSSPFKSNTRTSALDMSDILARSAALKEFEKSPTKSKKIIATSLAVLLALAVVGAAFYFKKVPEQKYTRNFVMATYVIQVGADKSRKVCQRIATDWKAKTDAGQTYIPRASADEEKDLNTIRIKLDSAKANLTVEPNKFKDCTEKLEKLENSYSKLSTLALSPGNSLQAFTDSTSKLDNEYKQVSKKFKLTIPGEMLEDLNLASKKFRGLRPLLQNQ